MSTRRRFLKRRSTGTENKRGISPRRVNLGSVTKSSKSPKTLKNNVSNSIKGNIAAVTIAPTPPLSSPPPPTPQLTTSNGGVGGGPGGNNNTVDEHGFPSDPMMDYKNHMFRQPQQQPPQTQPIQPSTPQQQPPTPQPASMDAKLALSASRRTKSGRRGSGATGSLWSRRGKGENKDNSNNDSFKGMTKTAVMTTNASPPPPMTPVVAPVMPVAPGAAPPGGGGGATAPPILNSPPPDNPTTVISPPSSAPKVRISMPTRTMPPPPPREASGMAPRRHRGGPLGGSGGNGPLVGVSVVGGPDADGDGDGEEEEEVVEPPQRNWRFDALDGLAMNVRELKNLKKKKGVEGEEQQQKVDSDADDVSTKSSASRATESRRQARLQKSRKVRESLTQLREYRDNKVQNEDNSASSRSTKSSRLNGGSFQKSASASARTRNAPSVDEMAPGQRWRSQINKPKEEVEEEEEEEEEDDNDDESEISDDNTLRSSAKAFRASLSSLVKVLYGLADNPNLPPSILPPILGHVPSVDMALSQIRPVLDEILKAEDSSDSSSESSSQHSDEEATEVIVEAYLDRLTKLSTMLSETVATAARSRVWTRNADACYATLLELIERTCSELEAVRIKNIDPEISLPWYPSGRVRRAWARGGHGDKLKMIKSEHKKNSSTLGIGIPDDAVTTVSERSRSSQWSRRSAVTNASASRSKPVDPEGFRETALEVILQSLEWAPTDVEDVRLACSAPEGVAEAVAMSGGGRRRGKAQRGDNNNNAAVVGGPLGDQFNSSFPPPTSSSSLRSMPKSSKIDFTPPPPTFDPMVMLPPLAKVALSKIRGGPVPRRVHSDRVARKLLRNRSIDGARSVNDHDDKSESTRGSYRSTSLEENVVYISSTPEGPPPKRNVHRSNSALRTSRTSLENVDEGSPLEGGALDSSSALKTLGASGVGKTTLAAMICCREDVQQYYKGMVWIDLSTIRSMRRIDNTDIPGEDFRGNKPKRQEVLTYDQYTKCLQSICQQLGWSDDFLPKNDKRKTWTLSPALGHQDGISPVATDPETESELARDAEVRAMSEVRVDFSNLLAEKISSDLTSTSSRKSNDKGQSSCILIVLDDVLTDEEVDWFRFSRSDSKLAKSDASHSSANDSRYWCQILATSRRRDLAHSSSATTVEVDGLTESEALDLLVRESSSEEASISSESRVIVSRCSYRPLSIRSAARWTGLKRATAGTARALEEVNEEIGACLEILNGSSGIPPGDIILHGIMDRMLSPVMHGRPTAVIKLCFAGLTQVFFRWPSPYGVPLAAATLLWGQLLDSEEEDLFQTGPGDENNSVATRRKRQVALISEALTSLGVVQVLNPNNDGAGKPSPKLISMHHEAQRRYGERLCNYNGGLLNLVNDAERRWNQLFVTSYLNKIGTEPGARSIRWKEPSSSSSDDEFGECRDYALRFLVSHMSRASMLQESRSLLKDDSFVRARLRTLESWEEAARLHVSDCEEVCRRLRQNACHNSDHPHDHSEEEDGGGAGGGGGSVARTEIRSTLVLSYAKVSSILCAEARAAESSVLEGAGRALRLIGLSLAKNRWCRTQAIAHYERSLDFLRILGDSEITASMLSDVASVRYEANQHDECVKDLGRCLKIRGQKWGEKDPSFLRILYSIGVVMKDACKYSKAMQCFDRAYTTLRADPSIDKVLFSDVLQAKGYLHFKGMELDVAKISFKQSLRLKVKELGKDHSSIARLLFHTGCVLYAKDEKEEAANCFEEAIRIKKLVSEKTKEDVADILIIEGCQHNANGKPEVSVECYEEALMLLRSSSELTSSELKKEKVAFILHLIAVAHVSDGDTGKAVSRFEESLHYRKTRSASRDGLDAAQTLMDLGSVLQRIGKDDKAFKCMEEALSIRREQLNDSFLVADTLLKMGNFHKTTGKLNKADTCYDEAMRIREKLYANDEQSVATILHERASQKSDMNDYHEAMAFYRESLDLRKRKLGNDHPEVADSLYSMGGTLIKKREYERANECLTEALRIRMGNLGKDHPAVGDTLNRLGYLQYKFENHQASLQLLWEALRIRKESNSLVKVADSLNHIGAVHVKKKQFELAQECYEECLRVRTEELGEGNEKVADAHIALGDVHSDTGKHNEACYHYRKGLNILRINGDTHSRISPLLQDLGVLELKAGNLDNALNHLQEFILLRKELGTDHDVDFVNALHIVGKIHNSRGEDGQAFQKWTEAYEIYERGGMKKNHPSVGEALEKLLRGMRDDDNSYEKSFFSTYLAGLSSEVAGGGGSTKGKSRDGTPSKRRKG